MIPFFTDHREEERAMFQAEYKEIERLAAERDKAREERDTLVDVFDRLKHDAASSLAALLLDATPEAQNFLTWELRTKDHGKLEMTLRRENGKTTSQVLDELRAEIVQLKAELSRYRATE